jgi:rubrerythrin
MTKLNSVLLLLFSFFLTVSCQGTSNGTSNNNLYAFINDNRVLNYALTLEKLEYAIYTAGLSSFTREQFLNAGINDTQYSYLQLFVQQEGVHIGLITNILSSRGWPAVGNCSYNLPNFTSVSDFLTIMGDTENQGVKAYLGSAPYVTSPELLTYAATIATVEARHSAFVYNLTGRSPFPNTTDASLSPSDVFSRVSSYFNTCNSTSLNTTYNGTVVANSKNLTLPLLSSVFKNSSVSNQTSGVFPAGLGLFVNRTAYANDNNVLNYALTLENLEAAYYNQIFENFTDAQILEAGVSSADLELLRTIRDQENAHVAAINLTLVNRGSIGVPACVYNFTFSNVSQALSLAVALENTGVSAYDGAIAFISDPALAATAGSIATVEGRHAAFLAELIGRSPFPNVLEPTASVSEVFMNASVYIISCPSVTDPFTGSAVGSTNLTVPQSLNYFNYAAPAAVPTTSTSTNTGNNGGTSTNSGTVSSASTIYLSSAALFLVVVIVFI